jgi:hypothetical protein
MNSLISFVASCMLVGMALVWVFVFTATAKRN